MEDPNDSIASLQVANELQHEEMSLAKAPLHHYRYGSGLVTAASEKSIVKMEEPTKMEDLSNSIASLQVTDDLRNEETSLAKVPLYPHQYGFGLVTASSDTAIPLKMAVMSTAKKERSDAVVIFAIRDTESQASQNLAKKLSQLDKELRHTSFLGIFKERQDQSILNFYSKYFRFPIYQDPKWRIFMALGERKWSRAFV